MTLFVMLSYKAAPCFSELEQNDMKVYSQEEMSHFFRDAAPLAFQGTQVIEPGSFVFRDESWQHILDFTQRNDIYAWDQPHNSDTSRFGCTDGSLLLDAPAKELNWNCFFYRNASANDFSLRFDISVENLFDEIQVSFNCLDLRRRCRFMIRSGQTAVFEVVDNGQFYRYLRQRDYAIHPNRLYSFQIEKVGTHYRLSIDRELIFSVENIGDIDFGRDLALILYNAHAERGVHCRITGLELKTSQKYKTRVGILTYHRSHNYGAFLQAFCLYKRLSQEDWLDCEVIDYRTKAEKRQYAPARVIGIRNHIRLILGRNMEHRFQKQLFRSFQQTGKENGLKKSRNHAFSDRIDAFTQLADGRYDIIICGSDEIWRTDSFRSYPTAYWLWGNLHAEKVAYAVSSRSDFGRLSSKEYEMLRCNLQGFSYLSVRDQPTAESVAALVPEKTVYRQCDPSFLYDIPPVSPENIIRRKAGISDNNKLLLFLVDMANDRQIAESVLQDLGNDYHIISLFRYHKGMKNIADVTPFEFVQMIKEADFVITNLFHGVCYSIIQNTPYLALCLNDKKEKILSLQRDCLDVKSRCIFDLEELSQGSLKDKVASLLCTRNSRSYIDENRTAFLDFIRRLKQISSDSDNIKII